MYTPKRLKSLWSYNGYKNAVSYTISATIKWLEEECYCAAYVVCINSQTSLPITPSKAPLVESGCDVIKDKTLPSFSGNEASSKS